MREVDKLLAGLALLSPHAVTGKVSTLSPDYVDAWHGVGMDCVGVDAAKEYTLKSLGWTWDCEVSTEVEQRGGVCWKFFFGED